MADAKQKRKEYMRAYYRDHPEKFRRTAGQQDKYNATRREKYAADQAFRDQCKTLAQEYRVNNPGRRRKADIRRMYGLPPDQYDAMLAAQGGACDICRVPFAGTPHVDHCHKSGAVRGLLCDGCNHGIGKFGDDPAAMRRAADYLERHQQQGEPTNGAA